MKSEKPALLTLPSSAIRFDPRSLWLVRPSAHYTAVERALGRIMLTWILTRNMTDKE